MTPDHRVEFRAPHVVSGISKNEIRIQIRMLGSVMLHCRLLRSFAHHSVRTINADGFVKFIVICANHSAFHRAEVVRVIKRKVRGPTHTAHAPTVVRRAVCFAAIFDQRNVALLQFIQQPLIQSVVAQHVRQKNGLRFVIHCVEHLRNIHPERARIDVHKHRLQARVQYRGDVAHPSQCGHDHFALAFKLPQRGHRHEVGGGTGMDEHAVLHAEPFAPFAFELAHVGRLREDRIVLLQKFHEAVQIRPCDVVAHQRPRAEGGGNFSDGGAIFHYKNLRTPRESCSCHLPACGLFHRQGTRLQVLRGE